MEDRAIKHSALSSAPSYGAPMPRMRDMAMKSSAQPQMLMKSAAVKKKSAGFGVMDALSSVGSSIASSVTGLFSNESKSKPQAEE